MVYLLFHCVFVLRDSILFPRQYNNVNHKFFRDACRELELHPKGEKGVNEGKALSLYLQLAEFETRRSEQKVYCECQLRIKTQVHGKDDESVGENLSFENPFCVLNVMHRKYLLFCQISFRVYCLNFSFYCLLSFFADLNYWFSTASRDFGCTDLVTLSDLNDTSKGFLVNDAMIIEAQFKFISSAKNF